MEPQDTLKFFFDPKSVALIGVSRDMNTFNGIVLKNLLEINYQGKIFLVNPHAKNILGIPCHERVVDLPVVPDLAIILHSNVVPILENCGKKGIKHVIIQADIMLQEKSERDKIERDIIAVASRHGIQYLGPSLIGLINFPSRFTSSIIPVRERIIRQGQDATRTGIGFMAQSGGLAGACGWWSPSQDVSFSKVIHFRDEMQGGISDGAIVRYMAADASVKIISMFLRHVSDSLLDAVRECSARKPILFKKCGLQSRVGELAGAGAIEVPTYLDLFEIAKAFIFSPLPRGNRIALIGPSSGAIDVVLSEFKRHGLLLAKPSPGVERDIRSLFHGSVPKRCNPVDYWPPPRFYGHEVGRLHHDAADLLLSDENIDALFLVLEFFNEIEFDLMIFTDIVRKYPGKPIMGVLIQAEAEGAFRMRRSATELRIPVYDEAERLVEAYTALWKHASMGAARGPATNH